MNTTSLGVFFFGFWNLFISLGVICGKSTHTQGSYQLNISDVDTPFLSLNLNTLDHSLRLVFPDSVPKAARVHRQIHRSIGQAVQWEVLDALRYERCQ